MATFTLNTDTRGSITLPSIDRANLTQEQLVAFFIPWTSWRVWDAYDSNLPGTPASDDLGLVGGTFGTASPSLQTRDLKAAGAQNVYARCSIWLPPEYDPGESMQFRFRTGMLTTVADTSALIDCEAYQSNNQAGIGSDLVSTAPQSINSLTLADKTFNVDATLLTPGAWLDVRLKFTVTDGASATAVKAIMGGAYYLLDIKG